MFLTFINGSLEGRYWIYSDKIRLNQILTNLVDNAVKFTKKDDNINITIKESDSFG